MNTDLPHNLKVNNRKPMASIVVPTFREADNLSPLVTSVSHVMASVDTQYEIIVVDDDSQDGSEQIVDNLLKQGHPVRIITRIGQKGLSSAVLCGFQQARGEILICMDADLSHPPQTIPQLIECLNDPQVDLVIGSRYVTGGSTDEKWGILRRLNSRIAMLLARPFTHVKDPMSGFFAIPRRVFQNAAPLNPIGYKIGLELIIKCPCKHIHEIPIHFSKRKLGQSKLNLKEQIKYIIHLLRLTIFKLTQIISNRK
ncbi:MAG: polyprenol monophosphomannose synthase [Planctomycetota bacterium]|jgi:dolichol-phosphate mannosyltransferase